MTRYRIPSTRNPTSPLGLGGLEWSVCFPPLFFSTLRVSTLWGGVYPSPYPALEIPSRSYPGPCVPFLFSRSLFFLVGVVWCGERVFYEKSNQFFIKNPLKKCPNRHPVRWGTPLLGLLRAKTEQCHELPVFWGALGAVLEPPWGRLGPSWAVLGASRSPSRSQKSKKINVKIEPIFVTLWEGYIFR